MASIRTKLREYFRIVSSSTRSKDILMYIMFLGIAAVFWVSLTLNTEIQEDITIPLELTEIPDSVTLIDNVPQALDVVVRDKGTSLVRYLWGNVPALKIQFKDYNDNIGVFLLKKNDIESRLRTYFGNSAHLQSSTPDSIRINYSSRPGIITPLKVNIDAKSHFQYIINGEISASVDSITCFSKKNQTIDIVETEPIILNNLKDTTRIKVRLKPMGGIKFVPDEVLITIPVEPLISKRQAMQVTSINNPNGQGLILFPSIVEMSYLVPMSEYSKNYENEISLFVDYNDIKMSSKIEKLPISISNAPHGFRNIEIKPDSVEYIIEQI